MSLTESIVEDATLEWFGELDYEVGHGQHFAPREPEAERASFGEVVLVERLRAALLRLNGAIPEDAREEALRKVLRVGTPSLTQTNRAFHKMLRDGVDVEYPRGEDSVIRNFRITAPDAKGYKTKHYSRQAISTVGFSRAGGCNWQEILVSSKSIARRLKS